MIVQRIRELLLEQAPIVAIFGDRIYPMQWPDAPEFPLVTLQKVAGLGEATNDGPAGIEGTRVQIDVYTDRGYADLVELTGLIKRQLHAFRGGPAAAPCAIDASFCINDTDQAVPATERAGPRLRRRMLEFKIWTTEG